jgi:NitT/TauT family transport system permease protein
MFLVAVVLFWEAIVRLGFWPPYSLPSPLTVLDRISTGIGNGTLLDAVGLSMRRMLVGFGVSLVLGISLGIAIARFRLVEQTIGSLVAGLQSLPSITWLPIALIWFGLSERAIIFVVILGSMMAITQATADGVKNTPQLFLRTASSLGARGPTLYTRVVLPASLPYMITGMKLGWSFAWRSLMAAELLFVTPGLGRLLEVGREFNDIAQVMGVMVVIVIAGLAVDRLVFVRLEDLVRRRWGLTGIRG